MSISAAYKQDKLSFALERVELQTEEAMLFQRQTNDNILLIKVSRYLCVYLSRCENKRKGYILKKAKLKKNNLCLGEPEILAVKEHPSAFFHLYLSDRRE